MKRILSLVLCLCCIWGLDLGALARTSAAADFPDHNIRWIVGYKPGGGFDTYSRAIARSMEKYLPSGIHVVVENHPGAASQQAASMIYNAEPDGYTIGIWPMPGLFIPQMFFDTTYDVHKVTWLATVLREPMIFAVSAKSKYKTLKELQAADSVRITLTGFSGPDLAVPITMDALGIKAKYITGHKSSREAILAAMRGDGDGVVFTFGSMRKHLLKKDFIPILLLGSDAREPEFPDVPTATEAGYPQLDETVIAWRVIGGPPGIPADRAHYLDDLLSKAMHDEEFVQWSKKSKRPVSPLNAAETTAKLQRLLAKYEGLRPMLSRFVK